MKTLLSVELLKLRTTRAPRWIVFGTTVVLALLAAVGLSFAGRQGAADLGTYRIMSSALRSVTQLAPAAILVLGILAAAGEFQHRTITSTLLVTPDRRRVLTAKLLLFLGLGAAWAVALMGLIGGIAVGWHVVAGETPVLDSDLLGIAAGVVAITALYGVAGVAIGALVRSTTGAVIGAVAWTTMVEDVLGLVVGKSRGKWLPGHAADAIITRTDGMLSAWAGGAVFATYIAAVAVAAAVLWMRRDAV